QDPGAALAADTPTADVAAVVRAGEAGAAMNPVPGLAYGADFATLRPVGHYTAGGKLPRYYRAMTWYGPVPLLVLGGDRGLVVAAEARRQTMAAALIACAVHDARLPDGRPAAAAWERVYFVTSFFAGLAADPGPRQYYAALTGLGDTPPDLAG